MGLRERLIQWIAKEQLEKLEAIARDVSNLNITVSHDQHNLRFDIERRLGRIEAAVASDRTLGDDFKQQMSLELAATKKALQEIRGISHSARKAQS